MQKKSINVSTLETVMVDCLWQYLKDNGATDADLKDLETKPFLNTLRSSLESCPALEPKGLEAWITPES